MGVAHLAGAHHVRGHEDGAFVGEVLDVSEHLLRLLAACSLVEVVHGIPLQRCLDAVWGVVLELQHLPGLQAVLLPLRLDEWHVLAEVVVLCGSMVVSLRERKDRVGGSLTMLNLAP